jgi:hypothetical protein
MAKAQLPRPKAHLDSCSNCSGSGLIPAASPPIARHRKLSIAVVAVLVEWHWLWLFAPRCLRYMSAIAALRARSQGYGLATSSKAIEGFSQNGVVSTRHLVHTTDGNVIGEWGMRNGCNPMPKAPKRTNIH